MLVDVEKPKKLNRKGHELVRDRTIMGGRLTLEEREGHA